MGDKLRTGRPAQARRAAQAQTANQAYLTIVGPNLLSVSELLGNWTDNTALDADVLV